MSYQQVPDGVRVVLSAPQLAAVLARRSISHSEMLSNQLWGGLQVVGGVLEMVGAAALCVLPEPTRASKAGGVVFGAQGSDTAAAGLRQVWTGRDTLTLTQVGTAKLAKAMNASTDMANSIGLSIDLAVPFGFSGSIKAARAASITAVLHPYSLPWIKERNESIRTLSGNGPSIYYLLRPGLRPVRSNGSRNSRLLQKRQSLSL